jgi:hypothetical protein
MTEAPTEDSPWLNSEAVGDRVRVHVPLKVPPWVLLYGGKQSLAMEVDGEAKILTVAVPPGSKPGSTLRLRKVAFGHQQVDLYVELQGFEIPQAAVVAVAVGAATVVAMIVFLLSSGAG